MKYSREELNAMPVSRLRMLDVLDKEDEVLVQEVISAKVALEPRVNPNPLLTSQTDGMTPEKEKELQAQIDAVVNPITVITGTPEAPVFSEVTSTIPVKKPFCDTCDALGPVRHKMSCPKAINYKK